RTEKAAPDDVSRTDGPRPQRAGDHPHTSGPRHILSLEAERVPAITAELFAEAIAVTDTVREAQGRGPVTSYRARDFWEILKELVDSVLDQ
ncbi:hypothetical protein AB0O52_23300, partial [Arthrobacter sp. NPDC080073]|uniref:hypothetical protein n=1 Tax=Arthrobacter sp. NPDC080073 TaxID=3155919 RepID=UPI00342BB728